MSRVDQDIHNQFLNNKNNITKIQNELLEVKKIIAILIYFI
jgi:hypothetical protein